MQFLLLVYNDDALLDALPDGEFDTRMRGCFDHADALREDGCLLQSQQLESAKKARSVRIRDGRTRVVDGPFAETKEVLAGFNLIEADSLDEAVRIAAEFPWAETGCIEVRPVRDMAAVRQRVAAARQPA
ncbi:MAG: YciI family protein [Lysobacter sp.]